VLEFAFRIPADRKMPRLQTKHLLRQLASRRLSKELATRPKQGFEAPVEQWIAGNFGHQLAADLFGPNAKVQSVLDSARLRRLYDAHQTRAADNSYVLWSAWVLERWMRLGSKSAASAPPRREHGAVVVDHRERMRSAAAARS
jgi:asparagine synthase (glutamine-hydrolysing)